MFTVLWRDLVPLNRVYIYGWRDIDICKEFVKRLICIRDLFSYRYRPACAMVVEERVVCSQHEVPAGGILKEKFWCGKILTKKSQREFKNKRDSWWILPGYHIYLRRVRHVMTARGASNPPQFPNTTGGAGPH